MSEKIPVAQRLSAVKPSATVAVAQRARELKAQGIDVLSFSVGEPDFDTPAHIREAAKKAIDSGATRYTAARGIPELREAICDASAKRRAGVTYEPSQVVVSVGAKHTLFNLALALYDEGDEVLIPAPYWVSYPEQVRLAGANPVIVQTTEEQGFRMTPEALRAAITPKTKALILCSPSNPTGAAYTGEQLRALADVAAEHNFWIIVDEIYGQLVYGGFEQKSIAEVAPDLKDRIIIVDGVSKTFAMTGWRIGWMLGPEYVTKACEKIQGQATTNPSSVAQHAAIAALRGPWEPMEEMRQAFEARRSIIVEGLNAIDGISCGMPEGAFYAFANVQALIGKEGGGKKLETDLDVAGYLLEEARCAVVPGTAFGAPGFVRISYAASNEMIREGLSRIGEALSKLG
ncbi:MAG: pyridoxal phosphate-dependent aminotransferase [Deltaproteobacteria bacterium]|nr:pyridoxal phosphate-dependent aminotransferase [Deltaproteobacteria bacterium]MBW1875482.1 pyridoxal phosphate-dependent aminotransferase [Deltaproteobacteria bacterium]MBW2588333.1 pyridoxal phosphate-dependent aminotransferase [Deltaproteobacteria bacterium]MBW2686706.1 pyridoxal phosphate-dependent aminotransferase [Deltaproteobacteria bacterium]